MGDSLEKAYREAMVLGRRHSAQLLLRSLRREVYSRDGLEVAGHLARILEERLSTVADEVS